MNLWPNWVDLVVVILLFISAYNGFSRGLFTSVLRLVGLGLVTVVTVNFSSVVTSYIQSWISLQPVLMAFLVFWLLFSTLIMAMRLLIDLIARIIKWEPVNALTQWLGLLLGGVRGACWAGIFMLALAVSGVTPLQASVEDHSMSAPYLLPAFHHYLEKCSERFPGTDNRYPTLFPPLLH